VSAIPPLILLADVERAVGGPVRLAQLTSSDESGTVDEPMVDWAIARATDRAAGILLSSWSLEEIQNLMALDTDARSCVADLAAYFLGSRKDDFVDPATGKFPFFHLGKEAETTLKGLRKGDHRSSAEEEVGMNRTLGVRAVRRPRPTKVFAGGRGGF
jgi:hypothetical protein